MEPCALLPSIAYPWPVSFPRSPITCPPDGCVMDLLSTPSHSPARGLACAQVQRFRPADHGLRGANPQAERGHPTPAVGLELRRQGGGRSGEDHSPPPPPPSSPRPPASLRVVSWSQADGQAGQRRPGILGTPRMAHAERVPL